MRSSAMLAALAALAGLAAAPARADVTIDGSRVYPESLTSDAAGNLYNGSNNGTIYRALKGARTAEPWITPNPENGLRSLFGVFADDDSLAAFGPNPLDPACREPSARAGRAQGRRIAEEVAEFLAG